MSHFFFCIDHEDCYGKSVPPPRSMWCTTIGWIWFTRRKWRHCPVFMAPRQSSRCTVCCNSSRKVANSRKTYGNIVPLCMTCKCFIWNGFTNTWDWKLCHFMNFQDHHNATPDHMRALQSGHWKCGNHAHPFDVTFAFGTRKANWFHFESTTSSRIRCIQFPSPFRTHSPCLETVRHINYNIYIILVTKKCKTNTRKKRYAVVAYTNFLNEQWQIEEYKKYQPFWNEQKENENEQKRWKKRELILFYIEMYSTKIIENLHWINVHNCRLIDKIWQHFV